MNRTKSSQSSVTMGSSSIYNGILPRNLRLKKSRERYDVCASQAYHVRPISISPSPAAANIKKPMRPLTAYHIFFQIEREYIVQTAAGSDADESIHANKSYLHDAPRRYRSIKLLPDWYAGPGKRQKRKHRKSHGKIGFLELSRVISKRWATLNTMDPETKRYVTRIAAHELGEYKIEMEEYKKITEMTSSVTDQQVLVDTSVGAAPSIGSMITPSTSPAPTFISSFYQPPTEISMPDAVCAELVLSLNEEFAIDSSSKDEDEVDYSICNVSTNGHYFPSLGPGSVHSDDSICDPLFELDYRYAEGELSNVNGSVCD